MRISDWSSDVCSSDLVRDGTAVRTTVLFRTRPGIARSATCCASEDAHAYATWKSGSQAAGGRVGGILRKLTRFNNIRTRERKEESPVGTECASTCSSLCGQTQLKKNPI